jgi:hypothetical protein
MRSVASLLVLNVLLSSQEDVLFKHGDPSAVEGELKIAIIRGYSKRRNDPESQRDS